MLTILKFKVLMSKERIEDLDNLKALFRLDTEGTIDAVYRDYREEFLNFGMKICPNREIVIDAFQDAIIGFYQNLIEDKILENKSSVKTYLFEIGRRQILKGIRKENSMKEKNELAIENIEDNSTLPNAEKDKIRFAVSKLGDTCQKLITLYYYRRYSIEAIMHNLNMKNENSVKANKSRCIKQLRTILESHSSKS